MDSMMHGESVYLNCDVYLRGCFVAAVSLITMAIAPGIALLAYFYLKDRYMSEPPAMVGKLFLIGVFIVFPTMVIQRGFFIWSGQHEVFLSFFISGALEEFIKWFVIYYYIYKHSEFDEPYDGIVYAVAVSLGFATLENVIYAWAHTLSPSALLFRALLPVSAHALFAVMMGYYFGKAKFSSNRPAWHVASAFFVPALWHGSYDFLLSSTVRWLWPIVLLMAAMWLLGIDKMKRANDRSPYRSMRTED